MKIFITLTTLLVAAALTTLTALAGDFADREIHGFSANGGLFAFEEYGRQDGSGFPFSSIYVIDTSTDQWTANSPFHAVLQDESKSIFDAREQARILAGPVMKSFENRGFVAGTNRATEISGNADQMIVNPRAVVPPIDDVLEFRIVKKSFAPSELCEAFGPTVGFTLLKIGTTNGADTEALHSDTAVPNSRSCPIDYSIADVVTYHPENASPKFAVLLHIKSQGFEGPNGRFLAVTGSF